VIRPLAAAAAALWIGAAVTATAGAAQEIGYSGGLYYASGDYVFDQRTEAFYLSNGLDLTVGTWNFGLTLPVIVQNGGVVTAVAGGVPLPTGGVDNGVMSHRQGGQPIGTKRHGGSGQAAVDSVSFNEGYETHVGDPSFSASRGVYSATGLLRSVRVSGSAKVPLNDVESGVGSGAWDWSAGGSIALGSGRTLLFASAAYWWLGDMPDLELKDALSYGLGSSFPAGPGTSVLVMLSGMTRTIETMEAPLSLAVSVSRSAGARGFLSAGLGAGLTESAPTVFAQVGWSIRM